MAEATGRDRVLRAQRGGRWRAPLPGAPFPTTWLPRSLRLGLASVLAAAGCENAYPIPPTPCDDYCWVTQRAGCEEDYPEGCVSRCEARAFTRRFPRCEPLWLGLIECYRLAPDSAFQCVEDESQPAPVCIAERVALNACVSPVRGACLEVCLREALECGNPARLCEARCRSMPPGCQDRERALYKCQLNGPVDCLDPAQETREISQIPCIAEIGALLECASR